MKNKLSVFNLRRKHFIKLLAVTSNRIEIEDSKIICYVDNNSLEKNKSQTFGYDYTFLDTDYFKHNQDIIKQYDIDKPIYYVIENMFFNDKIRFHLKKNSHIIFKNCTFTSSIELCGNKEGEVIFENNTYSINKKINIMEKPIICADVRNIKFNSENFISSNSNEDSRLLYFSMKLKAETIEIINSVLETNCLKSKLDLNAEMIDILFSKLNSAEICMVANNIDVYNSSIASENGILDIISEEVDFDKTFLHAPLISLTSKNINTTNTSIIAKTGIIIENENHNEINKIISPLILHNGKYNALINSEIIDSLMLLLKRKNLIQTLTNIKNEINKSDCFNQKLDGDTTDKVLKLK